MGSRPSHPASAFRPWAALMLWVWMLSQTACVAHCHGLLPTAPPEPDKPSSVVTSSGRAHRGHACCSRARSAKSGQVPDASEFADAVEASHASPQDTSSESPTMCAAKLAVHAADPLGNLALVSLTGEGRQPSAWMTSFGRAPDPLAILAETPVSPPGLEDASAPRWDAGYEPSVTLGCGLRSLAPPSRARA